MLGMTGGGGEGRGGGGDNIRYSGTVPVWGVRRLEREGQLENVLIITDLPERLISFSLLMIIVMDMLMNIIIFVPRGNG